MRNGLSTRAGHGRLVRQLTVRASSWYGGRRPGSAAGGVEPRRPAAPRARRHPAPRRDGRRLARPGVRGRRLDRGRRRLRHLSGAAGLSPRSRRDPEAGRRRGNLRAGPRAASADGGQDRGDRRVRGRRSAARQLRQAGAVDPASIRRWPSRSTPRRRHGPVAARTRAFFAGIVARAAALPGATGAAVVDYVPLGPGLQLDYTVSEWVEGRASRPTTSRCGSRAVTSAGLLPRDAIPIARGRAFAGAEPRARRPS